MNTALTQTEIEAALAADAGGVALGAAGWTVEREALAKTFTFGGFRDAMAWMVRVGFEAEAMNHHPEWTNVYNHVAVRLNTHDAGGKVTAKDVTLARRMETLARR